eukprot:3549987-Karenia_brevis.AAC.1
MSPHWGISTKKVVGAPVSPHVPVLLTINHKPHSIKTWQQVKPGKFSQEKRRGCTQAEMKQKLTWKTMPWMGNM